MEKMPGMAANEAGSFFLSNPDLAHILADTDFDVDNFFFFYFFGSQISRFLDFQIPRFPGCLPEIARAFSATAPPWLRGAPGPQSAGYPRNQDNTVRTPSAQALFGEF